MTSSAGKRFEFGQAVEREIYFARRAAIFEAANFLEELAGKLARIHELQEGEIGIEARRNDGGANFLAGIENDAFGTAVFDENSRDLHFGANFGAGFACCLPDGI